MRSILYKYRAFNEYSVEMLKAGTIWSALPISFNDPFDCKADIFSSIVNKISDFEKQHYVALNLINLKRAVDNNKPYLGLSIEESKKALEYIEKLESLDKAYLAIENIVNTAPIKLERITKDKVLKTIKESLSQIGVISLSTNQDNMLMWSHYADNHRGYCLGFEFKSLPIIKNNYICQAVNYVEHYPILDMDNVDCQISYHIGSNPKSSIKTNINDENLKKVIYTKAQCWNYENEWRILLPEGNKKEFYQGDLKEVIFGLRCTDDNQKEIIKAVKTYKKGFLNFKKIVTGNNSFKFGIIDI